MQNAEDPTKPTTILTPEEARQGETTGRMRRLVGISMLLAIFAGFGFLAYH
jgi:hypothetical protein